MEPAVFDITAKSADWAAHRKTGISACGSSRTSRLCGRLVRFPR